MCVKKSSIYMSGRGHGAGAELLSSRRAFLSCGVCASSSSALRFSAALLASGAGAGAFFFFFTTIDVRSFTGRFGRDTGGAAALSSRSSARCANSGADSPPSRSSLGADFSSSTWSEHSAARRRRGCWGCYKQVMSRGSRCEQVKKKKKKDIQYLECEILLQLAELFNFGFELCLAPVLDQLLRSKCRLLGLALVLTLTFTFTPALRVGGLG